MQEVKKKKKPWWLFIWDMQTPYFASNQPLNTICSTLTWYTIYTNNFNAKDSEDWAIITDLGCYFWFKLHTHERY